MRLYYVDIYLESFPSLSFFALSKTAHVYYLALIIGHFIKITLWRP